MRDTIHTIIIAAGLALALNNCGSSGSGDDSKGGNSSDSKKPKINANVDDSEIAKCTLGTNLSFDNFGKSFLAKHCVSCHSSASAFADARKRPLTNFDEVQLNRVAMIDASVKDTRMPPGYALNENEKAVLHEWLACGAP